MNLNFMSGLRPPVTQKGTWKCIW